MATVGVVNIGDKLHVLGNATDVENTKRLIILRKPPKIPSQSSNPSANILITNTSRRKQRTARDMTKVPQPPPMAVARRNARERNRVKQVNNGFATLRQHIPTAIAASYESGSGRGSNKKLSKVETLRMAVEYIKSLEKLLAISSPDDNITIPHTSPSNQSFTTIPSVSPTSSQLSLTYTYPTHMDDDDLTSVTSRTKNQVKTEYHLMDTHLYEDEENIYPSNIDEEILRETTLVDSKLEMSESHDISLLHSMDNNASLSPEVYSEHSLSPTSMHPNNVTTYIPVFSVPNTNLLPSFAHITYDSVPSVKSELLSPSATQPALEDELHTSKESQTLSVNNRAVILDEQSNMIQVMTWWQQQNRS